LRSGGGPPPYCCLTDLVGSSNLLPGFSLLTESVDLRSFALGQPKKDQDGQEKQSNHPCHCGHGFHFFELLVVSAGGASNASLPADPS